MNYMEMFVPHTESGAPARQCLIYKNTRFCLITDRLLRVENCKGAVFCDDPTQTVIRRNLGEVSFRIQKKKNNIRIITKKAQFEYNLSSEKMVSVTLSDGKRITDFDNGNLLGTTRTLDMVNGKTSLEKGLISRNGVTVLDDSKSLILASNGTIARRPSGQVDKYYFAYGHDYRGCIKALYGISGEVPLVPRFCLGNWWSRYKAYSQQEYSELMDRFKNERIPITVATIDMDWHWTDVVKRFGKEDAAFRFNPVIPKTIQTVIKNDGWTGYSWNTELFPDYRELLKKLHNDGYKVTLNIHPAQGIRPFEDVYEKTARAMGFDPKDKEHIPFDITNPNFLEAYFKCVHEPYENDGVDFWWIDWQQGKNTKIPGLDPLWALNHYHYLANGRDGKRPLILSRYSGIGSHRYPLGFSGDTVITWKSLDFQPYFTANAANAGYSWWSHDIGGHCLGNRDDELYIRWVQLGVFSPVNRLHSTSNEFSGKEPWKYSDGIGKCAGEYLRLRHRLIPYIYSMNRRTNTEGIALCEPMYYSYPENDESYTVPNEYFFGSEIICAPITKKADKKTGLACVKVWLPKGRFTDILTGRIYEGGRYYTIYRDVEKIPLFAREGAIIPMSSDGLSNSTALPESLDIMIYRGNNEFSLYEDDGETYAYRNGEFALTRFEVKQIGTDLRFRISVDDKENITPSKRSFRLLFKDTVDCEKALIQTKNRTVEAQIKRLNGTVVIELSGIDTSKEISVTLKRCTPLSNVPYRQAAIETISKYQLPPDLKLTVFGKLIDESSQIPFNNRFTQPLTELRRLKY